MNNSLESFLGSIPLHFAFKTDGLVLELPLEIKTMAKKEKLFLHEGKLKLAIAAEPVEGKANRAICLYLAKFFSVPKSFVELTKGDKSRKKIFLVYIPSAKLKALRETLEKIYEK